MSCLSALWWTLVLANSRAHTEADRHLTWQQQIGHAVAKRPDRRWYWRVIVCVQEKPNNHRQQQHPMISNDRTQRQTVDEKKKLNCDKIVRNLAGSALSVYTFSWLTKSIKANQKNCNQKSLAKQNTEMFSHISDEIKEWDRKRMSEWMDEQMGLKKHSIKIKMCVCVCVCVQNSSINKSRTLRLSLYLNTHTHTTLSFIDVVMDLQGWKENCCGDFSFLSLKADFKDKSVTKASSRNQTLLVQLVTVSNGPSACVYLIFTNGHSRSEQLIQSTPSQILDSRRSPSFPANVILAATTQAHKNTYRFVSPALGRHEMNKKLGDNHQRDQISSKFPQ